MIHSCWHRNLESSSACRRLWSCTHSHSRTFCIWCSRCSPCNWQSSSRISSLLPHPSHRPQRSQQWLSSGSPLRRYVVTRKTRPSLCGPCSCSLPCRSSAFGPTTAACCSCRAMGDRARCVPCSQQQVAATGNHLLGTFGGGGLYWRKPNLEQKPLRWLSGAGYRP